MKAFLVIAGLFLFALVTVFFHAGDGVKSASAPVAVNQTADNPAKAAKCKSALLSLRRSTGAWRSYNRAGAYGTVVVGPAFYAASFEDKRLMDATLRCVLSNGRDDNGGLTMVEYLDARTNKEVAVWSDSLGFSVD